MRTRNQSKKEEDSSETLTDKSREAIGKLLSRSNSRRTKKQVDPHQCEKLGMQRNESRGNDNQNVDITESCNNIVDGNAFLEHNIDGKINDEMEEPQWEDGLVPILDSSDLHSYNQFKEEVTVECNVSPGHIKQKSVRRVSSEDRELAELVHKVHLLCLLARGRLIDNACDDLLLQASLLSILPRHLLKISEIDKLSAKALLPIVNWFNEEFHVRCPSNEERSIPSALAYALETRGGSPEEVAALSVALFRSLNLTTRFVSILDVVSLKPEVGLSEGLGQNVSKADKGMFSSATPMVHKPDPVSTPSKYFPKNVEHTIFETPPMSGGCKRKHGHPSNSPSISPAIETLDSPSSEKLNNTPKRKSDIEFEMQLEMALSATAVGDYENNTSSHVKNVGESSLNSISWKRIKRIKREETSTTSQGISTAIGSKKVGPHLYWAEIYCSGENLTGKWVHVDAVNSIIDGEHNVDAAAAACRTSLRYVVAFCYQGAKDVTRRYCMKWHKISPQRVSSSWWDMVLAPLKELESRAELSESDSMKLSADALYATRNSLEDLELETRALTEPLPTNQQAYKNHHLYVLERWLTKHQILHPKGPVLGFCSGHPVYPRTCVQILKTKRQWLCEALQVKANELPVKVLKRPVKVHNAEIDDAEDNGKDDCGGNVALYGKWQVETLCLPRAVNGIVPKNERGHVDVWSEKCLPPGTVHLRLFRVFAVAKRLGIDYALAMVGFDYRNGRSFPLFDGIVVCAEFKEAVLEAYYEEEERREDEEKRRNETQAISRWHHLLSSIVTRRKLDACYRPNSTNADHFSVSPDFAALKTKSLAEIVARPLPSGDSKTGDPIGENHEHVFTKEEDGCLGVSTKRCRCGFSIQVEEM